SDGSHASRSAEQGLDLLYDLLLIEDGLNQRGLPVPEIVTQHIDRLARFVRALSHPDGGLCGFQGSESVPPERVAPALVHDDNRPHGQTAVPSLLDQGRYHRLAGRSLQVIADAGEPRSGPMGFAGCDYPMSFEVSGGRDRLIVSPGWSPRQSDRQDMRVVREGNTLSIGEKPLLAPVEGKFGELLNFTLEGDRYRIRARRVEAEDSGTLLEMEHEGWRVRYGVKHERRLYVDALRDELRGEDRLTPVEAKVEKLMTGPFVIAFRLHPEVQASLARDKKSVLLRAPGGRGWWFRHDAREIALSHGVVFENGLTRKTTVIELKGVSRPDAASRVRWKLSPAEA
ncbi:MAG: heparinase II/III domain-containing protein, partial [Asticcacaulis sp.]